MDIDLELKIEEMIECIRAKETDKFDEAIDALRSFGPQAMELLCLSFRQANEFEAMYLANAMSAIGEVALAHIVKMMPDLSGMKKCQAVFALGEINHEDSSGAIKAAFDDPDPQVRQAVLQTIEKAYRADYEAVLYKALNDKDTSIRILATGILGNTKSKMALDDLITMIQDSEPSVRSVAARALGKIADPAAAAALQRLLNDPVAIVASAACIALGEMGFEDNIHAIGEMLSNRSDLVRNSAIKALGRLRSSRAVPLLEGILSDENEQVRDLAAKVIKFLKEQGR